MDPAPRSPHAVGGTPKGFVLRAVLPPAARSPGRGAASPGRQLGQTTFEQYDAMSAASSRGRTAYSSKTLATAAIANYDASMLPSMLPSVHAGERSFAPPQNYAVQYANRLKPTRRAAAANAANAAHAQRPRRSSDAASRPPEGERAFRPPEIAVLVHRAVQRELLRVSVTRPWRLNNGTFVQPHGEPLAVLPRRTNRSLSPAQARAVTPEY
ncbi:hypothetical protein M885DRAFT_536038 [Pelagophyceae sp. CCMP2097]|nr:hypothetical protein M885DRAFT_536038 [Pelagophyceae sp. CCMP2097]|mmetsp:Transcript_10073/g.34844  ORF Transcript_10073/g.34844 Transcript_10073/m.34844 type:complete len:212 (+) Transcript_10073:106-741(+)